MLTDLPPELIAELHLAALAEDCVSMPVLIQRIEAHGPDAKRGLQRPVVVFSSGDRPHFPQN